jgi:hypothetical protein
MNVNFLPAILPDPRNGESDQVINIVIAYDTVAAGQRAVRLFSSLDRNQRGIGKFRPQPWRFDLLVDSDCCEFAAEDAMRADVIIVSASRGSDLPAALKTWLRTCLGRRRGTRIALVALMGTEEDMDGANSPRLEFLRNAASEFGFDFFAPLPAVTAGSAAIARQPEIPFVAPPQASDQGTLYRHWGIND